MGRKGSSRVDELLPSLGDSSRQLLARPSLPDKTGRRSPCVHAPSPHTSQGRRAR